MQTKARPKDGTVFMPDERATMKTVVDSNPSLMLDDPAIYADRPIACACCCDSVGEHNYQVTCLNRI